MGPFPPPHGGVEINLVGLRDFLRRTGSYCEVINLTRHRKREGDGVYYPVHSIDVLRLLLTKKVDVIHLHIGGNVSLRLLGLGLVCSLLPGRKVILTLHSGGYPSSRSARRARVFSLRGFLFRRFDGLIGVNQQLVEMFHKFGILQSRIQLILPFALASHVPDVSLPQDVRAFIETHSPVLLSVNGLEPEYDLPLQIEALELVRQGRPGAGLLIMGSGSREAEIRNQIRTKTYAEHILMAGDVSNEVVLRTMSLADVLLRTTVYDGDSIAIREALHFGLPVVATDNGMRPAGVILIPHSNQDMLRRAIYTALDTPRARRKSPGADANNLQAVTNFYRELVAQPDAGSRIRNWLRVGV